MTMFGNKDSFAVELTSVGDKVGSYRDYNFTYWIGGREVGNYNFLAPAEELIEDLRSALCNINVNVNSKLFKSSKDDIINDINKEDVAASDISYSMGHGYPLECGNRFLVYLFNHNGSGRIIVFSARDSSFFCEEMVETEKVYSALKQGFDMMVRETK